MTVAFDSLQMTLTEPSKAVISEAIRLRQVIDASLNPGSPNWPKDNVNYGSATSFLPF